MLGVRVYGRGTGGSWLILLVLFAISTTTTPPGFWPIVWLLAATAFVAWGATSIAKCGWRIPKTLVVILAVPAVAVGLLVLVSYAVQAGVAIAASLQQHGLAFTLHAQWHLWGQGALIVAIIAVPLGGLLWAGLKMRPKPITSQPLPPPDFPPWEQLGGGGPTPPNPAQWTDER
jgi:hypothetical protein